MESLIVFAVTTAIKMIDPITLLLACGFGYMAARSSNGPLRGILVAAGAAVIVLASAFLSWSSQTQAGLAFRFSWAATCAAALIQVTLVHLAVRIWRRRVA